MKLLPEQIEASGYRLIDSLEHSEIIPFINIYLYKRTRFSILYLLINLVLFGLLGVAGWKLSSAEDIGMAAGFSYLFMGIGIGFLLIPLHEYIHAVTYQWLGAKNTSFDADFKKFYFLAVADRFVADRREFQIVALAPFMVITFGTLMVWFFVGMLGSFTVLGTLIAHTSMTSGDFGLLSYFDFHQDKHIVTYDDKEKKFTYFFGKEK